MTSRLANGALVLAAIVLVGCAATEGAGEPYRVETARGTAELLGEEETAAPEEEGSEGRANRAALFLGTSRARDGEHGFTAGLDVAHLFNENFAVLAFGDLVAGDFRSSAFGAGVEVRAIGELWLVFAPGLEYGHGDFKTFIRVGGGYEFPIGQGTYVAPTFYYDIYSAEDVAIFGLTFGTEF